MVATYSIKSLTYCS